MPLVQQNLTHDLLGIFSSLNPNISQVAADVSQAYFDYATVATGPSGTPLIIKGTESYLLRQQLYLIMSKLMPAPAAASLIVSAIQSFWLVPPMLTASGGAVTLITPIAMAAALGMIANVHGPIPVAARIMATAMHTITSAVFVTEPILPFISGFII